MAGTAKPLCDGGGVMAWLLQKSIRIEDTPMAHWSPASVEDILASNAEVVSEYSGLSPDDPRYIKDGDAPVGLPLREPKTHREVVVDEMQGPLPDAPMQTVVNDRIRTIIEKLEPCVHQFFPTVLTLPDGSESHGWWNMRMAHRLDAIAFDHCEDVYKYRPRPEEYPDWYYYRSNMDSRTKLAVRNNVIAGKAIWYDWRFQRSFISEELGQIFIDEGVRGFCLPADELGRSVHVGEI